LWRAISSLWPGLEPIADRSRNCHRVERRADNLRRARTFRVIAGFGFEQLRMREDDSEVIIEVVSRARRSPASGDVVRPSFIVDSTSG
jgi:hypothetical protein